MPKLNDADRQAIRERRSVPVRSGSRRKPSKPVKCYHLFPVLGRLTPNTADYTGTVYAVSATSLRQAMALAYKGAWINPDDDYPLGIISEYVRERGYRLWCGCRGHWCAVDPGHGSGIRAIRAAIASHHCRE